MLEKNPEKVKIVYKNFPLGSHKFAVKAATAALAADEQGDFWEFHDLLYENYKVLNDQKIRDFVRILDLDEAKFNKKMKDPALQNQIRQDVLDGRRAGVKSIPSLFINGKYVKNRRPQNLQRVIDRELRRSVSTRP